MYIFSVFSGAWGSKSRALCGRAGVSSLLPCRKEARIPARELGALIPEASDAIFANFMSHFLLKNKGLRPLS